MRTVLKLAVPSLLLALSVGCASRQRQVRYDPPPPAPTPDVVVVPPPRTPHRPAPPSTHPVEEPWLDVTISTQERQIIRDYVLVHSDSGKHAKKGKNGKGLPPGLAKKAARGESLPPGWQKKMVPGQIMPVKVYRQCDPLPDPLMVRLPPPPPGTILVTIEGKVARLARATLEILDVFEVL